MNYQKTLNKLKKIESIIKKAIQYVDPGTPGAQRGPKGGYFIETEPEEKKPKEKKPKEETEEEKLFLNLPKLNKWKKAINEIKNRNEMEMAKRAFMSKLKDNFEKEYYPDEARKKVNKIIRKYKKEMGPFGGKLEDDKKLITDIIDELAQHV